MGMTFDKDELKKAILSKAFRGELTEQDYDEGTGKELLERIKSERQREQKGKKKVEISPVSKEEEPYELPPHWTWTRLGVICSMYGGGTPSKSVSAYWDGDVPWASVKDFKEDKYLTTTKDKISTLGVENSSTNFVKPGTLIVPTRMAVGKILISKIKTCINQDLKALTPQGAISSDFIYYMYKTLDIPTTGTTVKGVTQEILNNLLVPLPPLAEQHRIVAKIERAFELIDSMDVDSLLQDISDFRQEILTRAFRGDLTEQHFDEGTGMELIQSIQLDRQTQQPTKGKKKTELAPVLKEEEPYELPPNWTWTRLGEVVNGVEYGVTASASEDSSDSKMIRITDISMMGKVDWSNVPYCHIKESDKLRTAVQDGDILVARTGATVGKSTLITGTPNDAMYVYASYLIRLKNIKRMNPRFTKLFMESSEYWTQIIAQSSGTGQPNVNGTKLSSLTIPLPPLAEQHRIVAKIEAIFSALDVMEDAITKQKDEAKACYEEILRKEMGTAEADKKELETTSEELVEVKVG